MSFVGSLAEGVDVFVGAGQAGDAAAQGFYETAILDGFVGDSTNSIIRYGTGIAPERGQAWAILGIDGSIEGLPFFITNSTAYDLRVAASGENAVPPDTASRSVIWRWDAEASAAWNGWAPLELVHRFPEPGLLYTDEEITANFFADPDQLVRLTLRVYYRRIPLTDTEISRRRRA